MNAGLVTLLYVVGLVAPRCVWSTVHWEAVLCSEKAQLREPGRQLASVLTPSTCLLGLAVSSDTSKIGRMRRTFLQGFHEDER